LPVNAEPLGVLLARRVADEVAGAAGVRLDNLAALAWLSFPRSESPAWFDEILHRLTATSPPAPVSPSTETATPAGFRAVIEPPRSAPARDHSGRPKTHRPC